MGTLSALIENDWVLANCCVIATSGRAWSRGVLLQSRFDTKLNRRRHLRCAWEHVRRGLGHQPQRAPGVGPFQSLLLALFDVTCAGSAWPHTRIGKYFFRNGRERVHHPRAKPISMVRCQRLCSWIGHGVL